MCQSVGWLSEEQCEQASNDRERERDRGMERGVERERIEGASSKGGEMEAGGEVQYALAVRAQ